MNNIQQLIIDTYAQKPRHYTQILKRNKDVIDYIKDNVPYKITSFLEQLYYVVYQDAGVCDYNNKKKLKSFEGYTFCGKTGVCQCARESVSKSVSLKKKEYTDERIEEINEKRKQTTLEKYGVKNNGQTDNARQSHKDFYADKNKVQKVIDQIGATKEVKYGDRKFNNRKKAEDTCLEKYGVKNTWSLTEDKQNPNLDILRDKDKLSLLYPRLSVEEIGKQLNVHPHTVYRYLSTNGFREPYKSTFEKEIVYFLEELGVENIVTNSRKIIGKEIDIFLPDYNLAIEYNGVYWHHDKIPHITKTYHYDKFRECENKGIELFTIFSDSWDSKKQIWKNKIKSKLGKVQEKVYARETRVVPMSAASTRGILDNNHVQGYTASQYCYGLEVNGGIVAAMTFSKNRSGIGKDRGPDSYELVRYVTTRSVVGGASKLLKHFIRTHSPEVIVSYSDNQYSVGNLYNKLGFTLEKDNGPGYRYYSPQDKKMYHRYKYAKHNLVKAGFDANKTEFKITDEIGLLRIWDCGTKTWILNLKK